MVKILFDNKFVSIISKLKYGFLKTRIKNHIKKISKNPKIGKPMRNVRKGTRELYIKPFRLSYVYLLHENKIIFLDLYHKKKQ